MLSLMLPGIKVYAQSKAGPVDPLFQELSKETHAKLRSGGLILADNLLSRGAVSDPKTKDERAIVAFNDMVRTDPQVEAVLLTIRDGLFLIRKK